MTIIRVIGTCIGKKMAPTSFLTPNTQARCSVEIEQTNMGTTGHRLAGPSQVILTRTHGQSNIKNKASSSCLTKNGVGLSFVVMAKTKMVTIGYGSILKNLGKVAGKSNGGSLKLHDFKLK